MEREIFFSGIGGQGVQLAAKTLAVAAIHSGFKVMIFGSYGGLMRGGNTDATIVLGQETLHTPPIVDQAWAALMMHNYSWPVFGPKLRSGAFVLIDSSVFRGDATHDGPSLAIEASTLATEAGMSKAASMVALGAFVAATGIVTLDTLRSAAYEVLPPYRAQHGATNVKALEMGHGLVEAPLVEAWPKERTPA
jgi:Pyruvate/2-oxoacid:ferredoxin oxidoreductase gamma subunit